MNISQRKSKGGDWVERLLHAEVPELGEKQRFWWRVWILRFLGFCREPAHEGFELTVLAKGYLRELKTDPEMEDWKWSEALEALRVFARGIENWHWDDGKPRFRLRTRTATSSGNASASDDAGSPAECFEKGSPQGEGAQSQPDFGGHPSEGSPSWAIPADWRQRLQASLRVQHYSHRTEQSYLGWATRYVGSCTERNGEARVDEDDARHFLETLAVERRATASTQNQALSALLFFHRTLWNCDLAELAGTVRARRGEKLPTVLSQGEMRALLDQLDGTLRLLGDMLYGCGLRLQECLRLRVKDIDFNRQRIKGQSEGLNILAIAC